MTCSCLTQTTPMRWGFLTAAQRALGSALSNLVASQPPAKTKAEDPPAPASIVPEAGRSPEAERRQLMVMFYDQQGSTALSQQLDPEVVRDVIRSYQEVCAGAVARFEGHIA